MKKIALKADIGRIQATGQRIEMADSVVRGLRLRITSAGVKSWSLLYRVAGGVRRLDLGTFPEVTLAAARADAATEKSGIRKGADPQKAKVETRAKEKAAREAPIAGTVGATVAAYLETRRADLRPTTIRGWDRLAVQIADHFGKLSVKDLNRVTIREWLMILRTADHPTLRDEDGKPVKVKGYTANRSLEFLRLALDWAANNGTIPANPAAGLRRPSKRHKLNNDILARETKRERALSVMEVRAVLLALDELEKEAHRKGEGGATADALRLALLTGKRRSGVLAFRRSELSGLDGPEPLWELLAEREKNARAHEVPLSQDAIAIIRRRLDACDTRLELARTEAKKADAKPHTTIGEFLFSTHRDPKATKEPWWSLPEHPQQWFPQRFIKKLKERAAQIHGPMKPWTPHALRSTFATLLDDEVKIDRRVVSLLLNHSLDDTSIGLGYNLATKRKERRDALKEWGERLREWKALPPAEVLPMRKSA